MVKYMDKYYLKLFTEIASTVETLAEKTMEVQQDEKGLRAAKTMRDNYATLHDTLAAKDFDPASLTKAQYAQLSVGALLCVKQIEAHLENTQKALDGYKLNILPKLNRILNEAKSDEEVKSLAAELFKVDN